MGGNTMKMNKKGFTLIELLIVVAIIAILAAIAIPQFNAYRVRGFNGAAQSDIRNAKTVEEAVFAEYRAYGASESVASLLALNAPVAAGIMLTGPLPGATGSAVAAAGAIVTRIDSNNDQAYDSNAGFGASVSNNVQLQVGVNSAGAAVGVDLISYQMRAKHRDGNRGFTTNTNPAICYSENNGPANAAGSYMGIAMTAAAFPTVLADLIAPCGGTASDGNPVATYIAM
jgi:prepilin-type N-terminal cleavage/methylation domain-containing protein